MEGVELSPKIEREADKLLAQIALADSMNVAAKAGVRAEGFVLGLESARALSEATIDRLYVIFDSATEERRATCQAVNARDKAQCCSEDKAIRFLCPRGIQADGNSSTFRPLCRSVML